jgi:hypothetical protein
MPATYGTLFPLCAGFVGLALRAELRQRPMVVQRLWAGPIEPDQNESRRHRGQGRAPRRRRDTRPRHRRQRGGASPLTPAAQGAA